MENIFSSQLPSGQIPTLMVNSTEDWQQWVDTLAITMVAVYLAQLHPQWRRRWGNEVERALDFIESCAYVHEVEGFRVWHFNGFYPPDWEDTAMAVFLLVKNKRFRDLDLNGLRDILIQNSVSDYGTGVWVKDHYSRDNALNNVWDPTSSLNIFRLHFLLETGCEGRVEKFIGQQLLLERFDRATMYYRAPLAAFFARRLVRDFPNETREFRQQCNKFHAEVRSGVLDGRLTVTEFERTLLGLQGNQDEGLIFHHGKRQGIWYGSPVLHMLAREVL